MRDSPGSPVFLQPPVTPYEVMAQTEVFAFQINSTVVAEEFRRSGQFQQLVLSCFRLLLLQISQSALCHRFHRVDRRLSRWLLVAADRLGAEEFSLTQRCLAHLLGTPRTQVSMTASELQHQKLIDYRYGKIKIINRQKLERAACECYRVVKRETETLYQ